MMMEKHIYLSNDYRFVYIHVFHCCNCIKICFNKLLFDPRSLIKFYKGITITIFLANCYLEPVHLRLSCVIDRCTEDLYGQLSFILFFIIFLPLTFSLFFIGKAKITSIVWYYRYNWRRSRMQGRLAEKEIMQETHNSFFQPIRKYEKNNYNSRSSIIKQTFLNVVELYELNKSSKYFYLIDGSTRIILCDSISNDGWNKCIGSSRIIYSLLIIRSF